MEKYNNLKLKQLELNIKQLLTNAEIPIAMGYYLLSNILNEIDTLYQQIVTDELKQYQKENSEENQEEISTSPIVMQGEPIHIDLDKIGDENTHIVSAEDIGQE